MAYYAVENLNTKTGIRRELPFRFSTQKAAQEKIYELTQAHPDEVFIVRLVPAA
jgi:hypothetical protein